MESKTAFIFPAFITEFTRKEIDFLKINSVDINDYLNRISNVLNLELPEFSYDNKLYREELNSQILAYTISCAFTDILLSKAIFPDYLSGYSMGIYASLYTAKSVSFETGAKLIFKAFELVNELTETNLYGMGAIIGLSSKDVLELISNNELNLEIINVNNEHSLVIAGLKEDVQILLEKAKKEGALSAGELTVNTPYHSKYLENYSESFSDFLKNIEIYEATIPIISTFDQRKVLTIDDIKLELVYNLTQKINWFKTMQKLIDCRVEKMFECGAGKDLKKISRFIKGSYNLRSVYKI